MKLLACLLALAGCGATTEFKGSAKVSGGPAGCKAICEKWGMELTGMVQMGDYSNGCICQVRGASPAAGGAAAATAGVMMQMQDQRSIPNTAPTVTPGSSH